MNTQAEQPLSQLLHAFKHMAQLNQQLMQALLAPAPQAFFLPNYTGSATQQLSQAATSLTQLFYPELYKQEAAISDAGIICTSQAICELCQQLNAAKLDFKTAVQNVRQASKGSSSQSLDTLLSPYLDSKNKRDRELAEALEAIGMARLDLLKCYKQIRILPESLESISWTWARSHSKIERLTIKQAKQVAQNRISGELLERVHAKLNSLPIDTPIARMFTLPDQLRANITWYENEQRKRKAITISGVVLAPKKQLPKIVWRDKTPVKSERLTRFDTNINRQAFIAELNFYLYKNTP